MSELLPGFRIVDRAHSNPPDIRVASVRRIGGAVELDPALGDVPAGQVLKENRAMTDQFKSGRRSDRNRLPGKTGKKVA